MAVFKRKYRGGKTVWCFVIDAPGSTREIRHQIKESGFSTKAAAEHAEAERRIAEQKTRGKETGEENYRALSRTGSIPSGLSSRDAGLRNKTAASC
jgi:hypothetical protein